MWLTVVATCLVLGYVLKRILEYRKNLPPGPFNIPLLGSWEFLRLWWTGGSLTEMYARLGDKYGPIIFMRHVLDAPVVTIRQYDALKEAAKDPLLNGNTVPYLYRLMSDFSNYGISFSDGPKWHYNKKFTVATLGKLGFNKQRVMTMATNECSSAVEKLLTKKGQPVNIEHELFGAITNVVMQVLMSRQFDIDDPLFKQLREDGFTLFCIAAKLKSPYDFAPWLAYVAGENSDVRTLRRVMDRFAAFCAQVIEEHEATLCPDEPRDYVDAYLAAIPTAQASHDMSKDNLRVGLKDMIVGGMEGPSIILAWLLLLTAEHQEIQARMVAEIEEVIGFDRSPTLDDESRCPYVRAAIVETMRFVTLTPVHRHSASHGSTSLRGYHIPAGSMILEDVHSYNHDPAVFGDPETFRPERFLGERGEQLRKHEATFGFGPRQCPAIAYSYTVLFIFLVGLLQRLKLVLPEGAEPQSNRGAYNVGVRPSQPVLIALPR
ncbi:Farnesoate epoxidase [Amphibalanus amphitrite]|uniref:Farnesoate epoxidase n=1 Tax=Amphibalanus amphitrite TaxID=1232801 RepID=A0A6A4WBQ5_AMPAM|nr:Farnesoate epoxidase [Amphibalanus amphitrite]